MCMYITLLSNLLFFLGLPHSHQLPGVKVEHHTYGENIYLHIHVFVFQW